MKQLGIDLEIACRVLPSIPRSASSPSSLDVWTWLDVTISGDHDDDVPTRLAALGDKVFFDVATNCWLCYSLNLNRC